MDGFIIGKFVRVIITLKKYCKENVNGSSFVSPSIKKYNKENDNGSSFVSPSIKKYNKGNDNGPSFVSPSNLYTVKEIYSQEFQWGIKSVLIFYLGY